MDREFKRPSRGRGGSRGARGAMRRGRGSHLRGSSGRKRIFMEDDDLLGYHDDFVKYPNTIFKVTKVNKEGRADEVVTQTITANFLKECLVEPLIE